MKRLISLLLILTIILSSFTFVHAESGLSNFTKSRQYKSGIFSDVDENGWYFNNVKTAYELGLMKGSSNTEFNPDGEITISETIALAARLHRIYYAGEDDFVMGTPWYQVYVDYAVKNNIINAGDYTDMTAKATRQQFAYIMTKALPLSEFQTINIVDDGIIPDVEKNSVYYDAIYMFYRSGILSGNDSKGTFAPENHIGRSSVAALVTRMVDKSLRVNVTLRDLSNRKEITVKNVDELIKNIGSNRIIKMEAGTYNLTTCID